MRYVVVGAGAIGATVGGRLADTGHDVVLVARGAHLDALRSRGLELAMPDRVLRLELPATSAEELALEPGDVLLLAVKAQDTESVLGTLAGRRVGTSSAGEQLPLLCLQNGTSNEDAALRFFAQVHGVCVNIPATHLEPGRVEANGAPFSGVLQIGRFPGGVDEVDTTTVAQLRASGFDATAREDVMAWKRAKLSRNVGNALEVLCGRDSDPRSVSQALRAEAEECFQRAGLTVVGDQEWDEPLAGRSRSVTIDGRERQGGSTWQSVQRGQGSVETDFLNGEIVRLGRLHGVATPVNARVQREMWAVLRGDVEAGSVAPASLLDG